MATEKAQIYCYKVRVYCDNCGFGEIRIATLKDGHKNIALAIPRGTKFEDHILTTTCEQCGCTGTFRKI